MQNAAHADDSEPGRQVPVMVHCKRRHAVARLHAHAHKSRRQPTRIVRDALPISPVRASVCASRYDLAIAVLSFRMVEDPRDAERKVLRCAKRHRRLPFEKRIMTQKQLCTRA
jgi:hypothetical protein